MNILGLIFSLLLIFSYGYYACWDKHVATSRLRSTYYSHQRLSRNLLNAYEWKVFEDLPGNNSAPNKPRKSNLKSKKEAKDEDEDEKEKSLKFNRECARINLWPLIHEGRESHPIVYELAAKLIRTFYTSLNPGKKGFEYTL